MEENHGSNQRGFDHDIHPGNRIAERMESRNLDRSTALYFDDDRAKCCPFGDDRALRDFEPVGRPQPDAEASMNFSVRHVRSSSRQPWRARAGGLTIISPLRLVEVEARYGHKKSRRVLRSGDIALIPPSSDGEYQFGAMDALVMTLPGRAIAAALETIGRIHETEIVFRRVDRARDLLLAEMLTELCDEKEHAMPNGGKYAEALGTAIVVRIIKRYGERAPEARAWGTSMADLRVRRTLEFLEDRMMHDVPMADVARHVGLSGPHLSEVFKEATGETISAYTRRRRLQRARELLGSGGMTVGEVAQLVGYASAAHFATAFKVAFGVPPGAYRKSVFG
jgi:AraC-like DNA-binding protein